MIGSKTDNFAQLKRALTHSVHRKLPNSDVANQMHLAPKLFEKASVMENLFAKNDVYLNSQKSFYLAAELQRSKNYDCP